MGKIMHKFMTIQSSSQRSFTQGMIMLAFVAILAIAGSDYLVSSHAAAISGPVYYVSTTGNDINPGTQAAPWRTIGHAAIAATTAGSTVNIVAGNYSENVTLSKAGTAGGVITFQNNATDAVTTKSFTVNVSHVAIKGLTVTGASNDCIWIAPALTDISVSSNQVTNCGRDGIHFKRPEYSGAAYSTQITIQNNKIYHVGTIDTSGNDLTIYGDYVTVQSNDLTDTPNDAINLWGDHQTYQKNTIHDISNIYSHHNDAFQTWTGLNDGAEGKAVTNLVFAQNTVHNITGANAHCSNAEGPGHTNWQIYDNIFWSIGDQCLILANVGSGTQGIQNVSVYNNTFVSAGVHNAIEFNLTTTAKLANNIFYNCVGWSGGVPYYIGSGASVTRGYNLAGGTTTQLTETGAVNANPMFVNSSSDFHLTSASPAINTGDNGSIVSPVRTVDLDGKATSVVVDIGAYEY